MKTFFIFFLIHAFAQSNFAFMDRKDQTDSPQTLKINGKSCGRTRGGGDGITCSATECFGPNHVRFANWAQFEKREITGEKGLLNQVKFMDQDLDFKDICPNFANFSKADREMFVLDFLKLTVAYESNFLTLEAYDDWNYKANIPDTARGFFQMSYGNCPDEMKNYCDTHDPVLNTRCALRVMHDTVAQQKGTTLERLSHHWGSMKSSAKNADGGRREKMQKIFANNPTCIQKNSAQYNRLTKKMLPVETADIWGDANIIPSWQPAEEDDNGNAVADWCARNQNVAVNKRRCARKRTWECYAAMSEKWQVARPVETGEDLTNR